jgi:hypothetical protein
MMGRAPDSLYLREPVTQGDPLFHLKGGLFDPDEPDVRERHRQLADKAFRAWPDFADKIVRMPEQWALRDRTERRLVIKEVNPSALSKYLEQYRPRLVFLVRHPAAVALSITKQGWMIDEPAAWPDNGKWQGIHLSRAWKAIQGYSDVEFVSYEQLCMDPLTHFGRLFEFAQLTLSDAVRDLILRYSQDNERRIGAWRAEVSGEKATGLRESFRQYNLPWYRDDAVW